MGFDPISYLMGKKAGGGGGGGSTIVPKTITVNGTYSASSDNADGYSPVTVNVGGVVLPAEYQRVKYLSVTGTQYAEISTSSLINKNLIISFTAEAASGTGERGFVGKFESTTFLEIYFDSNSLGYYPGEELLSDVSNNVIYSGEFNFNSYNASTMYVGIYRPDRYLFVGNIYEFKISEQLNMAWENSNLEPILPQTFIHLIPCYRKSDNEPGFYDVANDVFYTNVGTGEFGIGPEV